MTNRHPFYNHSDDLESDSLADQLMNSLKSKIQIQNDTKLNDLECLERDEIPVEIAEKLELIPVDSPESIALGELLKPISEQLLESIKKTDFAKKEFSQFGLEHQDVQFAISSNESGNACVLKHTKSAIICLNKGLFVGQDAVTTIDALAFVIAHELSHKALEAKYGVGASSKGEEGLADLLGLEIAHHAGFDIRESITFIKQIKEDPKNADERLAALLATHPKFGTRLGIIQAGITSIEKEVEKLSINPTPISKTELATLASGINPTPLREPSSFLQSFKKHQLLIDEPSTKNMLEGISQAMEFADFEDHRTAGDITSLLRSARIQKEQTNADDSINKLADLAISIYEGSFSNKYHPDGITKQHEGNKIFHLVSDLASRDPKIKPQPLGRWAKINNAIIKLQESSDRKEVLSASRELLTVLNQEPLKHSDLFHDVNWSQFRLSLKRDSTVPWQPIYEAVTRLQTSDRQDVIKALISLGVNDTRLYSYMNLETYLDAIQGKSAIFPGPKAVSKSGSQIYSQNLEISGSGSIDAAGSAGSDISLRLRSERLGRIPALAEQTFAKLNPENTSTKDVQQLLLAAHLLQEFHKDHNVASEYLIGLKHIDKNPEAFCRINKIPINAHPSLQHQVVSALQELVATKSTEARDVIRSVLGVTSNYGLEPFFFNVNFNKEEGLNNWDRKEGAVLGLPLAKWLLNLPSEYVSSAEKLKLLFDTEATLAAYRIVLCSVPRMKVAYSLLQADYPEMLSPVDSFDDLFQKHSNFSNKAGTAISEEAKHSLLEAEFRQLALQQIPKAAELLKLVEKVPGWALEFDPLLSEHLRKQFLKTSPEWSPDPVAAINEWKLLHDNSLLPPDKGYRMLSQLIERADTQTDSSTQSKIYETLLRGTRIAEPHLRDTCIHNWTQSIKQTIGTDDQSSQFSSALKDVVERISIINPVLRTEMLNSLGKTLLTQRASTKLIEEGLPGLSREHLENTQLHGIILEEIFSLTRRDPFARKEVFQYLITPLSKISIDHFLEVVPRTIPTLEFLPEEGDKEFREVFNNRRTVESARQFHRNFWAAPFEARALLARDLFLPADDTSPEQYDEMFDLALQCTFPKHLNYSEQAQEFVRAYIKNVPDYSKELAISALMVAAEKTSQRHSGVGFALASFLETMGPAETKAGQAAGSHPSVPAEIRADLGRLKTQASEPTRSQLWEQIENSIPEDIANNIESVGRVLGSASFYVVAEVTMKDGSPQVLALLRNHALTRAENGFGLMSAMAIDLGKDHKAFNTLEELIDQAKELAKMESNPILSKDQIELAQTIYNGTKVIVGNSEYEFNVPNVTAVGSNFRLMDKAAGEHFDDIRKGNDSERKREIAKAIAVVEINNILRGLPFDDDRHGGNCKIEANTISHYDFGGMMLAKPSDEELRVFSSIVLNAIDSAVSGADFSDAYFKEMKDIREQQGSVPAMIKHAQKALLMLGDCRACFKDDDMFDVLVSAAAHSPHPILQQAAVSKAMTAMMNGMKDPQQAALMQKFMTKLSNPPIKIIRAENTKQP